MSVGNLELLERRQNTVSNAGNILSEKVRQLLHCNNQRTTIIVIVQYVAIHFWHVLLPGFGQALAATTAHCERRPARSQRREPPNAARQQISTSGSRAVRGRQGQHAGTSAA